MNEFFQFKKKIVELKNLITTIKADFKIKTNGKFLSLRITLQKFLPY